MYPTEFELFIWIMSPLWSKKTSVAATDERNIIILHRKIVNNFTSHMTHVKPFPMVILTLYMMDVQFGEVIILFMLLNA